MKRLERKGQIMTNSHTGGYFINIDPAGNFIHKDSCPEYKKMDPTKNEGEIYHSEEKYDEIISNFRVKNVNIKDCLKCNPP